MKKILLISLIIYSNNAVAEWVEYSTRPNGNVFYFDNARVLKTGNHLSVWNRVRYKTSLMGASSYQSFLNIDCSEAKPKKNIETDSATKELTDILCMD